MVAEVGEGAGAGDAQFEFVVGDGVGVDSGALDVPSQSIEGGVPVAQCGVAVAGGQCEGELEEAQSHRRVVPEFRGHVRGEPVRVIDEFPPPGFTAREGVLRAREQVAEGIVGFGIGHAFRRSQMSPELARGEDSNARGRG